MKNVVPFFLLAHLPELSEEFYLKLRVLDSQSSSLENEILL